MARFPCSIDAARYRGPQQTFYINVVKGAEELRVHLRLCPLHFTAAQDHLAEFKVNPADGTTSWFGTGAKCISCFEPMNEYGWQVFGTSYPTNEEREDYWGALHDEHDLPPCLTLNPDSWPPRAETYVQPTLFPAVPGVATTGKGKASASK